MEQASLTPANRQTSMRSLWLAFALSLIVLAVGLWRGPSQPGEPWGDLSVVIAFSYALLPARHTQRHAVKGLFLIAGAVFVGLFAYSLLFSR